MTSKKIIRTVLLCAVLVLSMAGILAVGALADEGEHVHDGITFTAWESTNSLPTEAGNYYLTADVSLSGTWSVPSGDTHLDLCGHAVTLTAESGNVVYVPSGANLTLYDCEDGGKITGGNESVGAGVRVFGSFTMNGGTISGNTATSYGGGVEVNGTFTMNGGRIVGNTATSEGGGVKMESGTFIMTGGTVSGNTSVRGGGLYIYQGTAHLSGGEISENTASDKGGGVYNSSGTFRVSGNARVTGNMTNGAANNVYLPNGKTVAVAGILTEDALIGVTTEKTPSKGNRVTVTSGLSENGGSLSTFASDNENYRVISSADGTEAALGIIYTVTFNENGGEGIMDPVTCVDGESVAIENKFVRYKHSFVFWSTSSDGTGTVYYDDELLSPTDNVTLYAIWLKGEPEEHIHDGIAFKPWPVSAGLPGRSGNYYLVEDVTIGSRWTIPDERIINLDLNGNDITLNSSSLSVIKIDGNASVLSVYDSEGTGIITGGKDGSIVDSCLNGGGVCVYSGSFNMYGGTIGGNQVKHPHYPYNGAYGGGVFVSSSGTFTMYGGAISGNSAPGGGGVAVKGTFIMNGGKIANNQATDGSFWGDAIPRGGGHGVLVQENGSFIMNGGSIQDNEGSNTNGSVGILGGSFTMNGGSIDSNRCSGIILYCTNYSGGSNSPSTFCLNAGTISGNLGTGIAVWNDCSFLLNGGDISDNAAADKLIDGKSIGGVYLRDNASFTMTGGTIEGNTGSTCGGVYAEGTVNLSGDVKIAGNALSDGTASNLYLSADQLINVTAPFGENASVGVSTGTKPGIEEPVKFTKGLLQYAGADGVKAFFADSTEEDVEPTYSGYEANLITKYTVSFDPNGAEGTMEPAVSRNGSEISTIHTYTRDGYIFLFWNTEPDGTGTVYEETASVVPESSLTLYAIWTNDIHDGITFLPWPHTDRLPSVPGSFYLTGDVTLSSTWSVPNGVSNLCLDGHSVTLSGASGSVINVPSGAELTLFDPVGTGVVSGGNASAGAGVRVFGVFTLNGGEISGNTASSYGGGVEVNGTFTMNGGRIKENTAANEGGGVKMQTGVFYMNGGVISGNTSARGGGLYVYQGTAHIAGGEISGNAASNQGGGVYNGSGTFGVSGAPRITGNTKNGIENNVYLGSGQKVTVEDALNGSARIGITTQYLPTAGKPVVLTAGLGENGSGAGAFVPDDSDEKAIRVLSGENEASLVVAYTVTFDPNGGEGEINPVTLYNGESTIIPENPFVNEGYPFVAWNTLPSGGGAEYRPGDEYTPAKSMTLYAVWLIHSHDGVGFLAWGKTDSLPAEAGHYYLLNDVTLSSTWVVPTGESSLCLNGHRITLAASSGSVIEIPEGAELTLYDCEGGGVLTGGKATGTGGGGVYVNGGSFTMKAGTVSGCMASRGGGVYVKNGSAFRMEGGFLTGNNASIAGGGAYVETGADFRISGDVRITGNSQKGTESNVFLPDGQIITVVGILSENAAIGVTPEIVPAAGEIVSVTEGLTENGGTVRAVFSDDPSLMIFASDDEKEAVLAVPYLLTFDGNGADGEMEPLTERTGKPVTVPENGFTRDGYYFLNWNTEPDGSGDSFLPEDPVTSMDSLTLYAIWQDYHVMTKTERVEPDHHHAGNIEYYSCEVCGKLFLDEEGENEITLEDTVLEMIPHTFSDDWTMNRTSHWRECECGDRIDYAPHSGGQADCLHRAECEICGTSYGELGAHALSKVERVEPDHHKTGNIEYFVCDLCGKLFLDEAGETEIIPAETVLPVIPHDFSEEWTSDESGHWHECSCGDREDFAEHAYDDEYDEVCNICGYSRTVNVLPRIILQPKGVTVETGKSASFSVQAIGGAVTYQWQYSKDNGATWKTWSGKTASSVTVKAGETNNGTLYRVTVKNKTGSVDSASAKLTVSGVKPAIILQPKAVSVARGATAAFSVTASGTGLTYQWQYSKDNGVTWKTWSGKTASSVSVKASETNNGTLYRVVVKNDIGSVDSAGVKLTVTGVKPAIVLQPKAATVANGATAAFSVTASGTGLTYQWQYSKDNGATWKTWSGKTASSVSVKASATNNGTLYRVVVKNEAGTVNSTGVKLTVSGVKPAIILQPKAATVANGATATFSVTASGTGLTYQWQYSKDNGTTWKTWSGKTSSSVSVKASATNNGTLYRVAVTNDEGTTYSAGVKLTVSGVKPAIILQPKAASVTSGASATFRVTASGTGLTYQWQYSTNNGATWKTWSGKTASSVTVKASATNNGTLYRVAVTNDAGTTYSAGVKLTVK